MPFLDDTPLCYLSPQFSSISPCTRGMSYAGISLLWGQKGGKGSERFRDFYKASPGTGCSRP